MSMLTVRLGAEDERVATALRRAGVSISPLVRAALRAELRRQQGDAQRPKRSARVEAILEQVPLPKSTPRLPRSDDRVARQRAIQARAARRR